MKDLTLIITAILVSAVLIAVPAQSHDFGAPAQARGKLTLLRVHHLDSGYGDSADPTNFIDVEVVLWLDSQPGKAFGFQVRDDDHLPAHRGMLDLLRDAFNNNWTVTINYIAPDLSDPDQTKKNFLVTRVWLAAKRAAEVDTTFQYAVKFLCGKATGIEKLFVKDGVAPGRYYTAINVHNPWDKRIGFKKKFAIALPLQKTGGVTPFFDVRLRPDEALEIDCQDIFNLTADISTADFRTGFAVIETDVELDIVSVYTTSNFETEQIITQDIERVAPRVIIVPPLPDKQPDID